MPTYATTAAFKRDYSRLSAEEKERFKRAVLDKFVPDLVAGKFRAGLGVRRYQARAEVWEMRWAPDGRALFTYGEEHKPSEKHIVWLNIGGHEIFE